MKFFKIIFIILILIGGLVIWQFTRPVQALTEKTYYKLDPGQNGLLTFQTFRDSTLIVTYVYVGDTIVTDYINRSEFNQILTLIYGNDKKEKVMHLEVIAPKKELY